MSSITLEETISTATRATSVRKWGVENSVTEGYCWRGRLETEDRATLHIINLN